MFGNELLIVLLALAGIAAIVPPIAKEAKVVGHYIGRKVVQTAKVVHKAVR